MKYFLVAEADRIQELVFRGSKLKEVRVGSQKLSEWCTDEVKNILKECHIANETCDVIVNDGGSVKIIFDKEADALTVKRYLSESYFMHLGSTLSVVIEPYKEGMCFKKLQENAQEKLKYAKYNPIPISNEMHNPYVAICSDCGEYMAEKHIFEEGKEILLCPYCFQRYESLKNGFEFYQTLDMDEIGCSDKAQNVVHVVADGNNMGVLFSNLDKEELKEFSKQFPLLIEKCIKKAVKEVGKHLDIKLYQSISGGDDIYLIIPGRCSILFISVFAKAYCEAIRETLENIVPDKFKHPNDSRNQIEDITLSIGAVLCKSSTPYSLAYKRAHELLDKAKTKARSYKKNFLAMAVFNKQYKKEDEKNIFLLDEENLQENNEPISLYQLTACKKKLSNIPTSRINSIVTALDLKDKVRRQEKLVYLMQRVRISEESKNGSLISTESEENQKSQEVLLKEALYDLAGIKWTEDSIDIGDEKENYLSSLWDLWDCIGEEV